MSLNIGGMETHRQKAFVSLALDIIEALYIPKIDSRYINKHIRIENLKFLDEALKREKGDSPGLSFRQLGVVYIHLQPGGI